MRKSPDKIQQENNRILLNFAHFMEWTEKMGLQFFDVGIWPKTSKIGGKHFFKGKKREKMRKKCGKMRKNAIFRESQKDAQKMRKNAQKCAFPKNRKHV